MNAKDFDYTTILHVPKQNPVPDPIADKMRAVIASHPPLGQVTHVEAGSEVPFTVLLEVHESRVAEAWQVALWHSAEQNGQEWTETLLSPVGSRDAPSNLQDLEPGIARSFYAVRLPVKASLSFTIKFRPGTAEPWRWIGHEQGMGDGRLLVGTGPSSGVSDKLGDYIQGLNPCLAVREVMSQCPGTQLWSVEATVEGVREDKSNLVDIELGLPWGGFLRSVGTIRADSSSAYCLCPPGGSGW